MNNIDAMSDVVFEKWLHDNLAGNRKPIDETRLVFTHLLHSVIGVSHRDVMRQLGLATHGQLVACVTSGTLPPPRRTSPGQVQWSQVEVEAAKSIRQLYRRSA